MEETIWSVDESAAFGQYRPSFAAMRNKRTASADDGSETEMGD